MKSEVAETIIRVLEPFQKKYFKYLEDKSKLDEILKIGKEKAELQANKKIREVYDKLGILG